MSTLPDEALQGEADSSEHPIGGSMPYELEIDGFMFTQEEPGGQHKVSYTNSELNEIALLPNPRKFDTVEDREIQIDVWKHNGERYKAAGLPTADQNYDDKGDLVESGYITGTTEINGEEHPFLRCYFNPHLNSIEHLKSRSRLYNDKREEIIDAVITLDNLKREGEIATAEDTVNWKEVADELDVVYERDIPQGGVVNYGELSEEIKYDLGKDFQQALFNDTSIPQSSPDIYFKDDINPRELVLEKGLPSSAGGLINALKYNDKTGDIVVSDLGECADAVFNEGNNRYEVRFDSVDEFANYHEITGSTRNRAPAALDD